MASDRTTWQHFFQAPPQATTFMGQNTLLVDIVTQVVLYLDPMCTQHWAKQIPVIAEVESNPHYQQTWWQHHSTFPKNNYVKLVKPPHKVMRAVAALPIHFPEGTPKIAKLSIYEVSQKCSARFNQAVILIQRRLDKVVLHNIDSYCSAEPLLAVYLAYNHNKLYTMYLLSALYAYLSNDDRTAVTDKIYDTVLRSKYPVTVDMVTSIHELYQAHARNPAAFTGLYKVLAAVITKTSVDFSLYANPRAQYLFAVTAGVYDNVELLKFITQAENDIIHITYRLATRNNSQDIQQYIRHLQLGGPC